MTRPVDLYELLPAIHRSEDASLGYPLEALLDIISTEVEHVQRNITDLWDDFFIETADEWVVPYLGDLVGATPLHDVAGSRKADVANTIAYRRRKGTVAMLEDLAADVTGWGARVVDLFELLAWSQHLDHVRRQPSAHPGRSARVGTADVSDPDALDLLDGPFDRIAHTVDVRPFGERRGRHNLRKVAFFLWRLQSYPLFGVDARQSPDHPHGYHLSPLGNDAPLFTNIGAPGPGRRGESDLPGPIRPLALRADVVDAGEEAVASGYYGPESHHSVAVAVGDPHGEIRADLIAASDACVCDLADWRRPPEGKHVAIDPVRGRITLSAEREPGPGEVVRASLCYGFSGGAGGDLGGGPYDRLDSLRAPPPGAFTAEVSQRGAAAFDAIDAAIAAWRARAPEPGATGVIDILDSATYAEGDLLAEVPEGCRLEIRARNGQRPVLDVGELRAQGAGAGDARLVLNGLVVLGGPVRLGPGLSALDLRHCTLVPGQAFTAEGQAAAPGAPALVAAEEAQDCHVLVSHSILGPVELPADGLALTVASSVVDGGSAETAIGGPDDDVGPRCDLRRVTVLGDVRVRTLSYASEVLFDGTVTCERTQVGCVRFSWVPPGSVTPQRYRCQPDAALEDADPGARARVRSRLQPRFTSRRYGNPGYAQLSADAAAELRTGAADGGQIGALNRLREAQREANLRLRLDEYLPAGLEAGLIYVT